MKSNFYVNSLAIELTMGKFLARSILILGFLYGIVTTSMDIQAEDAPIRYSIFFREIEQHVIEVEAAIPTSGAPSIDLMMPVWTPGSYLVREYARHIESIQVIDPKSGTSLSIEKKSKNIWTVACPGCDLIEVRYRLYCREMSVRTNWVERDFGFLTGAATFITRRDWLAHPHWVQLELPPSWPDVATSLEKSDGKNTAFRKAASYDELVDSPILMGKLDTQTFEVSGKKHELVTAMHDGLWDTKQAAADAAKIIAVEHEFWGEVPYPHYTFLNVVSETGGGLEHDNSSVLMANRFAMKKKGSYIDWLALVSHEFFHTWNVRRLRPKVLMQYDYSNEQYFPELWIAEGVTSYYDDLFVANAGLRTRDEYLSSLSKHIAGVQQATGRLVQPLHDASWDAWIKFYRPDENAGNTRMSYYVKGAVVAWLLDTEIQRSTDGQKRLRDVMQGLWKEHRATGYTMEDFERITSQVAGRPMKEWLDGNIRQASELNYKPALEWYGLRFKSNDKKPADDKTKGTPDAADAAKKTAEAPQPPMDGWLGCEGGVTDGKWLVKRVPRGTPANLAGLNVDDELIAIDGYRLSGADALNDRLSYYKAGVSVEILIARRGKLISLKATLGSKPTESWNLEVDPNATEAQKARLQSWIGPAISGK